ncbi:hypothetical protein VNI00_003736 [Paramarasmius palmivorus]|uniref:Uncharacterized protein n=1 Tax=Paramarasmius palmivorus TaxID=297713 RepID=A0AAW0DSE1_9AGAR
MFSNRDKINASRRKAGLTPHSKPNTSEPGALMREREPVVQEPYGGQGVMRLSEQSQEFWTLRMTSIRGRLEKIIGKASNNGQRALAAYHQAIEVSTDNEAVAYLDQLHSDLEKLQSYVYDCMVGVIDKLGAGKVYSEYEDFKGDMVVLVSWIADLTLQAMDGGIIPSAETFTITIAIATSSRLIMAYTRNKAAEKAKKKANNPSSARRRRSMRVMRNVAFQRDQTLRPVYILPMDTRHVRWLSKELYLWFFEHIWNRTYVEGINKVHQKIVKRWPQYGFYNHDTELQRRLEHVRKEEIREWLHRHASMEMFYKGEYAREVSDLGYSIAADEYEQGFSDSREREPCGAEEFFYNGILYKLSDTRYAVKRDIEGSFSLNKLLYSGLFPLPQ